MLSPETVNQSDTFDSMFGGSLDHLIRVASEWPGYEEITKKLKKYRENFKSITCKLAAPKPQDKFAVLNHGDLWTNNFMFAYGNAANLNKPTKAIFVSRKCILTCRLKLYLAN